MPDFHSTLYFLKEHKIEILLLLFLGGLLTYVYSLVSDEETGEPFGEPDYVLKLDQVQIEDYWLDQKRWKVFGKNASIAKNNSVVLLSDVKILIFDAHPPKPAEIDIVVTADKGTIDWKKEIVTLTSQVKMTRQTEMRIQTEKAIYHYQEGVLHIPDNVDMHYLQDSVIGEALTYYVYQKKIELQRATWLE